MDKELWKKRGLKTLGFLTIGYALILINPDPDHEPFKTFNNTKQEVKKTITQSYDTNLVKMIKSINEHPSHAGQSRDSTKIYLTQLLRSETGNGIVDLTIPNLNNYKIQEMIRNKINNPCLDTIIYLQHHNRDGKFLGEFEDTVRNKQISEKNKSKLEEFTKTYYKN